MSFLSGRTSLTTVQAGDIATDAITTAKIAASAVTTAKIAANNIDSTLTKDALIADYTEVTIATGDSLLLGDVNDSGNTKRDTVQGLLDLVSSGGFTLAAEQATTSGSSVTFGSIPAGKTMIVIMLEDVSQTGANQTLNITIGAAGGLETSGYDSGSMALANNPSNLTSTSSFPLWGATPGASSRQCGIIFLCLKDSSAFTWSAGGSVNDPADAGTSRGAIVNGTKDLSAELTQLQIVTNGTFDAGSISIMYQ
jgi:hypothetical protein